MDKKNLILLVELGVLIIIGGLSYYFFTNKNVLDKISETNIDVENLLIIDEKGITSFNSKNLGDTLRQLDIADLNVEEKAGLAYMREEEKLAFDTYTVLFGKFHQTVLIISPRVNRLILTL